MASKIPQKVEELGTEGPETSTDRPLLDLSDTAVKALIRSAKKRGYVTHDQINAMLASDEVNSEQIENILAMFAGDAKTEIALHPRAYDARETAFGPGHLRGRRQSDDRSFLPRVAHGIGIPRTHGSCGECGRKSRPFTQPTCLRGLLGLRAPQFQLLLRPLD
jgi:hypothetical protein